MSVHEPPGRQARVLKGAAVLPHRPGMVPPCAHSSLVGGEGTSGGRDLLYAQGSYEQTYQMALSMAAEGAAAADAKQPVRQPHEGTQERKREEGVYGGY